MPFRCITCRTLQRKDDNPSCETRDKCYFERVEIIHYISIAGSGRAYGNVKVQSVSNTGPETITESINTKLHCGTISQNIIVSDILDAVTCLDCLSTIEKE